MSDTDPTEIAIAVVEFEDQFLIGERPEGAPLAGYWEFPGGKVEPGESPSDAAARECLEETGIEVEIGEAYPEVVHQYDHGKLRLHFFRASPDVFTLPSNKRFLWVRRDQLSDYRFPEANAALTRYLCEDEQTPPRDFKFWLGPIHVITLLVFAGLLVNYDREAGTPVGLVIAVIGFVLLAMSVINKVAARGSQFSLQQIFFDMTAFCVTCVFASAIGWPAFLIWVPLILLRRL